jgi:hypothetical protein
MDSAAGDLSAAADATTWDSGVGAADLAAPTWDSGVGAADVTTPDSSVD